MVGSVMVLVDCTDASFSVSDNIATPSVYGAALVMKVISPNGSLRLLAHEQSSLFANASQQDKIIPEPGHKDNIYSPGWKMVEGKEEYRRARVCERASERRWRSGGDH